MMLTNLKESVESMALEKLEMENRVFFLENYYLEDYYQNCTIGEQKLG